MKTREKPWHKNASNLVVLNSILAASAAIVISSVHGHIVWFSCAVLALLLFIVSAEKITEAFDEDDVRTYVAYFVPYNVGVLFLFAAFVGIIRHEMAPSPWTNWATIIAATILLYVWCAVWGKDTGYVLFKGNGVFERYLKKLEGEDDFQNGGYDCWTRFFYKLRSLLCRKQDPPHCNVYARLKPSSIHGVGVFAITDIKAGTRMFPDDETILWVDEKDVADLPVNIKQLYDDFAIIKEGRYGCPVSFNKLTPAWYLNDSDHPNVRVDEHYDMFALRDIREGEELTIDSSRFSKQPYKNRA